MAIVYKFLFRPVRFVAKRWLIETLLENCWTPQWKHHNIKVIWFLLLHQFCIFTDPLDSWNTQAAYLFMGWKWIYSSVVCVLVGPFFVASFNAELQFVALVPNSCIALFIALTHNTQHTPYENKHVRIFYNRVVNHILELQVNYD